MSKKTFVASLALIGLSSFVILGSSPNFYGKFFQSIENTSIVKAFSLSSAKDETQNSSLNRIAASQEVVSGQEVPQTILWQMVFSLPQRLDRAAGKLSAQGKDAAIWNNYLTRQAKLSVQNELILKATAARYFAEIAPIDQKAREITQQTRAKYPDGKIEKDNFPLPPVELGVLQKQKDDITLLYRDSFRTAVGEESFNQFNDFLTQEFSKGISPIVQPTPKLSR